MWKIVLEMDFETAFMSGFLEFSRNDFL